MAASLGAGAYLGWSAAWSRRVPAPTGTAPAPAPVPSPPGVSISGAVLVLRSEGRRQAEVHAGQADVSADGQFTRFRGVRQADLYRDSAPALRLRAGEIVLDRATGDFTVLGDVEVAILRGDAVSSALGTDGVSSTPDSAAPRRSAGSSAGSTPPVETGRLQAERVRYDTRSRVFVAEGHVRLTVGEVEIRADQLRLDQRAQVATAHGQVVVQQPGARLTADSVRYEIRSRTAEAEGHVVLAQGDLVLRAGRMRFDLATRMTQASAGVTVTQKGLEVQAPSLVHDGRTDQVTAEGGVRLSRGGSILTGERLAASLRVLRAEVSGGARLVRPAMPAEGDDPAADTLTREETIITAERIRFRWDAPEAEALGGVEVRQRDRTARAARGYYNEADGRLVLEGEVVVDGLTGDLFLSEGERPADGETRRTMAMPARVACDRLTLFLRSRDMEAEGRVRVTQGARQATGDRARYTHRGRSVVVMGSVHMQDEDGNRLRADRVIIALQEEAFEAFGNVQTEFKVRRGP